jgi:hypothetical protein
MYKNIIKYVIYAIRHKMHIVQSTILKQSYKFNNQV